MSECSDGGAEDAEQVDGELDGELDGVQSRWTVERGLDWKRKMKW